MSSPRRNPNVPAIPTVVPNALLPVLRAMKEGIESLSGQRGALEDRAVTFNDLVRMGVITSAAAASATGTATTTTVVEAPRGWVTPEDYGAIGDGTSRPAGTHLGLATLAELQEYNGGVFSFADSLDNEMDWLAVQAAIYAGGEVVGRSGATYRLDKVLLVPNGTVLPRGLNMSWANMTQVPDDGSNLITNPDFSLGSTGWQNTSLSPRIDAVFSGGKASVTDLPATGLPGETHFAQFGQLVTLPPGKWTVRATMKLSEGASAGARGARVAGFGFYKDGPGIGGWEYPDQLYTISRAGAQRYSPFDGTFSFDVEVLEEVEAWLTFSGFNCDWEVTFVRISPFLANYGVITTGDGVTNAPYEETVWRDCTFTGPAQDIGYVYIGPDIDGILNTSWRGEGKRSSFENCHFRWFRYGSVYANQAFLVRHEGCTWGYCQEDVKFLDGAQNAGENLRFTNCILFNSGLAVAADGGGEWNFNGCSFDYCVSLVRALKGAVINLSNQHFEHHPVETRIYLASVTTPFTEDATLTGGSSGATARIIDYVEDSHLVVEVLSGTFTDDETLTDDAGGSGTASGDVEWAPYAWDLRGGSIVTVPSGYQLQSGSGHNGALHAAYLESTLDTIAFGDVLGFNWATASGDWATGAGRVTFRNLLGPGNALLPRMMLRSQHMDAFGGNGGIRGTGTWEDQGFGVSLPDSIGIDYSTHSAEGSGVSSRGLIPWEQAVTGETSVYRTTGRGSMKLQMNSVYVPGELQTRIFVPVTAGKVVLAEFFHSKPDAKTLRTWGPYTSGAPSAGDTILVSITEGQSLATIEDKHILSLARWGPRTGWTVTLSGVTGNPGGIANATWNATHTVVDRTGDYTYTIELGTDASASASGGGGSAIVATYSQTNVLVFVRQFWVQSYLRDAYDRPKLTQMQFQGEDEILVDLDTQDWQRVNLGSWYAEPAIPDTAIDRVARGRAPDWATHYMIVIDWAAIVECDTVDPPPWYLTDFFANVL